MQIDKLRYAKEWELMRRAFPEFRAFARPPQFGWEGYLRGKKSGQLYLIVLSSTESTYPANRPKVFSTPRCGHHWYTDGSMCIESPWDPALHTFANTLLRVIEYLETNNA